MPAPDAHPLLILTAMGEEAAPLEERLLEVREAPVPFAAPVRAVTGLLEGTPVLLVTTGIGVAAAAAALAWAVTAHRPTAAVSAGTCGGLAADIEVGTLVVGETYRWSIADATAFGYATGQVPGEPVEHTADPTLAAAAAEAAGTVGAEGGVRCGLMLSGDAFVTSPLAGPMRDRFPGALTADMESTAHARTARALGVPFVAVRAVSDLCGPAADQQFHLELAVAADVSARAVTALARSRAAGADRAGV